MSQRKRQPAVRFNVTAPPEFLKALDEHVLALDNTNRSEYIRDIILRHDSAFRMRLRKITEKQYSA